MKTTRILSFVLALVMIFGMLPASAFAADSADETVNGLTVEITHVSLKPAQDALGFKEPQILSDCRLSYSQSLSKF